MAVGGKFVSATEFWQMTPGQVWWMLEDVVPNLFADKPRNMEEVRNLVKRAKLKEKKAQAHE